MVVLLEVIGIADSTNPADGTVELAGVQPRRMSDEQERAANVQDVCHQISETAEGIAEGQGLSEAGQEKVRADLN
jgi:hypothetical protein